MLATDFSLRKNEPIALSDHDLREFVHTNGILLLGAVGRIYLHTF